MNFALFEDAQYKNLLPLTWLRTACGLRCGRDRLIDKIRSNLADGIMRVFVRPELRESITDRFDPTTDNPDDDWCLINTRALITAPVLPPPAGAAWFWRGSPVALTVRAAEFATLPEDLFLDEERFEDWTRGFAHEPIPTCIQLINYPWDLISANPAELRRQCDAGGVHEGRICPGAHLLNPSAIHVGPDAVVKPGAVLDAEDGPIHLDRGVQIQPNAVLIGPCYIGPGSVIRPGAIIRENTSIGPVCKIGGEIEGSIFQGYSNKQHDGFFGHGYVAEWVNLGADTVTSDLKNTYGTIRVSLCGQPIETGLHFVGSIIGDHAKTGIGTILPTGCVIGVAANIFTQNAVPKFVPSFAWLTDSAMTGCRVEKIIDIARTVMQRRECVLTPADVELLKKTEQLARVAENAGWK